MEIFQATAADRERTVLDEMQRHGIRFSAPCSGRGTCGNCRIRFCSAPPAPTAKEREHLSEAQLNAGWRLACQSKSAAGFTVEYSSREEEIAAETGLYRHNDAPAAASGRTKIAVDLGTTTIAAALVDAESGAVLSIQTGINHQRAFGSDVISRIQASCEGKGALLQETVLRDIRTLTEKLGADPDTCPLILSGNTTMQHLMQGLDCRTLGVAPYTPVDISLRQVDLVTYLPGICTFVGSDIVSGICACGMDQSDGISLFLDLGTNGEMAVGSRNRLLVASTAAGPAFEGGNISCGVAGIPGAIAGVRIQNSEAHCLTLQDKPPIGLCGTGVLETVYELLANEIADETGSLNPPYEKGFPLPGGIVFTQADLREVQLAKAAIRAGLDTLLDECGVSYDDITDVYLAGGFGQKINLAKAAGIGMLPKALVPKAHPVGNSSLAGAIAYAHDADMPARIVRTAKLAKEVSLAENRTFSRRYIDAMLFEED